jgi:two-component system, chemotaxis family, protein-glutamate methylesterase/glutaminase
VVQDPANAEVQDMPRSALRHVQVDHCLPLAALPALLERLARRATAAQPWQPPHELAIELALMRKRRNGMHRLNEIGTPSTFVCPECHGTLWALHGSELPRFRCHTGHAYTLRTLQHALALASDEANWNALRALAERGELLQRLAERYRADGEALAARHAEQAAHAVQHQQQTLRELIERSPVEPE